MAAIVLACWVCVPVALLELAFYAFFRVFLVPTANERVDEPQPYRDYRRGEHHTLVLRILERVFLKAKGDSDDVQAGREAIRDFLLSWFVEHGDDDHRTASPQSSADNAISDTGDGSMYSDSTTTTLTTEREMKFSSADGAVLVDHHIIYHRGATHNSSSYGRYSVEISAEGDDATCVQQPKSCWTINELGKVDIDALFAWAEFGKDVNQLSDEEQKDMAQTFVGLKQRFGLYFCAGSTHKYRVKRQTLDDLTVTHRLLLVYFLVWCIRLYAIGRLLWAGFRPRRSHSGLLGWVRPSRGSTKMLPPLVFFHGIAPAGIAMYLPLVFNGLLAADERRTVFLFENPAISWSIFSGWRNLRPEAVLGGVQEIMNPVVSKDTRICIAGHSFGTVPLTWLLYCPDMRDRIKQVILLDPISILLSSPDVMNNFLYREDSMINLISKELLVQHSLRRHFAWYNSDLFFEDMPTEDIQYLVCLSERDDIINFKEVKKEVERHSSERDIDVFVWPGRHGTCLFQPQKWNEIRAWMQQKHASSTVKKFLPV